jgi:heme-degrading monooxygenase HmoA
MQMLAINHEVEDYDRWKAVFDEFPPSSGGAVFHRVNRNVDDPNNITVVAGFETTEAARAFVDNADLKEAMHRAGVTSQPRIEIFEEVEAIQY